MHLREYLKVSSLLLLTLVLSSCSSWPKLTQIEVQTVEVERNIPIQNRPQPITMNTTMKWWVVTEENFKEFIEKFQKENGDPLVAYVLSVRDYETLALNMAEIRRYIEQQKEIIIYYEEAAKPRDEKEIMK
jgi:ABC-type glycerol-3-phosphate transport system substrate-binding protein